MSLFSRSRSFIPYVSLHRTQRRSLHNVFDVLDQRLQVYLSTSRDPFLNLSIEHYLLQKSHPESTILLLYTNSPSVVIGRNQNPWTEVNLHAIRQGLSSSTSSAPPTPIALVRRRSGGGTVFHDEGNTNWSVICPPANFTRDKHGEMVVRALQGLGVRDVRVNCRHDIVMGAQGSEVKVSGSAYKLTRLRSLHHGTCLLRSPNLTSIGGLLRSPAEAFIKARGVESVRSRVGNVDVESEAFCEAVRMEFEQMYGGKAETRRLDDGGWEQPSQLVKGFEELKSREWIYGQTPQFTFSTHATEADSRGRERPESLPPDFRASFVARHGRLQNVVIHGLPYRDDIDRASQDEALSATLAGRELHTITDWTKTLNDASPVPLTNTHVGSWLSRLFGLNG